jgi:hypothetical protein
VLCRPGPGLPLGREHPGLLLQVGRHTTQEVGGDQVRFIGGGHAFAHAPDESFFSLLQKNVLDRRRWNTRVELRIAIITWIERTYHRRRRQAA